MFGVEIEKPKIHPPLAIKCHRCGKIIAYIQKDSSRYDRALILDKAISDHKNNCTITGDISF